MLGFYGRDLGVRVARKHLGWYLDDLPESAALRARILRLTDPAGVLAALRANLADKAAAAVAA
jgi:tRNA-dihydrouridine synthase